MRPINSAPQEGKLGRSRRALTLRPCALGPLGRVMGIAQEIPHPSTHPAPLDSHASIPAWRLARGNEAFSQRTFGSGERHGGLGEPQRADRRLTLRLAAGNSSIILPQNLLGSGRIANRSRLLPCYMTCKVTLRWVEWLIGESQFWS